jgi:hypothetical protein
MGNFITCTTVSKNGIQSERTTTNFSIPYFVCPFTAGFVKTLSTPLVETKRRLCYAHVTVSRFYGTTVCISDLETNELVVSTSTHFPQSGVHLKSFISPSIVWYLETVSPQKVREGEQTEVSRTLVCWNTHAFTHVASLRTFSSHALSTSSWCSTPEYKAPRAEEVAEGCSISTYVISNPTTNDGCCIEKKESLLFLPHLLLLRLLVLSLGSLFQCSSFSTHHDARSAQPAANDQGTPLLTRESE